MKDKCPITISFYDTACSCCFLYDPNLVFANDPLTISSFAYHHHNIRFYITNGNLRYSGIKSIFIISLENAIFEKTKRITGYPCIFI